MRHLDEAGEGYFEHGWFALRFALILFIACCAAVIHAVFPCMFKKTASEAVRYLVVLLDERNQTH